MVVELGDRYIQLEYVYNNLYLFGVRVMAVVAGGFEKLHKPDRFPAYT